MAAVLALAPTSSQPIKNSGIALAIPTPTTPPQLANALGRREAHHPINQCGFASHLNNTFPITCQDRTLSCAAIFDEHAHAWAVCSQIGAATISFPTTAYGSWDRLSCPTSALCCPHGVGTTHYVAAGYTVTDQWCFPNDHVTTMVADTNILDPEKFSASLASARSAASSSATASPVSISSDDFGTAVKAAVSVGTLFIAACIAVTVWLCYRVRNKRRAKHDVASAPLQQQDLSTSYNQQQVPYDPPPPPGWSPMGWQYPQPTSATEMKDYSYYKPEAERPAHELDTNVPTSPELGSERKT